MKRIREEGGNGDAGVDDDNEDDDDLDDLDLDADLSDSTNAETGERERVDDRLFEWLDADAIKDIDENVI